MRQEESLGYWHFSRGGNGQAAAANVARAEPRFLTGLEDPWRRGVEESRRRGESRADLSGQGEGEEDEAREREEGTEFEGEKVERDEERQHEKEGRHEAGGGEEEKLKGQVEKLKEEGENKSYGAKGDLKKLYCRPTYPTEVFQALHELRQSSLLTDLTLSTEDGLSLQAHSPVVAAVSSLIQQKLQERDGEGERGVSVCVGAEVGRAGLAAVMEFAYTGAIAALNRHTVAQIQAAALSLGVPRVLDLCREEEEERKEGGARKAEDRKRKMSAAEQMKVSHQSIRQLWVERVGCDVELKAEGRIFHAHRVLLAASSDFFRGMFTSGMRESQQPSVALLLLDASELEAFLHCSYSGSLALSWGCVFELTCTALQFQFQPALALCLDFLCQEMDAHTCLDVASFAKAYGMGQLCELADDFVLRHFQEVATTRKFLDLSVEKLRKYLQSDTLCVPSELPVFRAVVAWIEVDLRKRVRLAKELLGHVQFSLMSFEEFKEVRAITTWPWRCARRFYESVLKDFNSSPSGAPKQCRVYLPKDTLVLVGGEMITADYEKRLISRELWFSNSLRNHTGIVKDVEWRMLGEIPERPRFSHGVGVLGGKLYVVGGRDYFGIEDTVKFTYRFDPLQNSWQRLADMQEKRCNFSMVVLEERIYAIGGNEDTESILETVECYCPNQDSWSFTCPLDQALSGHAATVWGGEIYISGGFNCKYQCLVSMFLYHPERGTTYLSEMSNNRSQHCMESLGDRLYVTGGISADVNGQYIDQLTCEIYNPVGDSWSATRPLPKPHVGAASAVLEEKLYILGGYCEEDYSVSRLVHRYNPASQRWETMGRMPGPYTDIRACLLRLPAHLRQ